MLVIKGIMRSFGVELAELVPAVARVGSAFVVVVVNVVDPNGTWELGSVELFPSQQIHLL